MLFRKKKSLKDKEDIRKFKNMMDEIIDEGDDIKRELNFFYGFRSSITSVLYLSSIVGIVSGFSQFISSGSTRKIGIYTLFNSAILLSASVAMLMYVISRVHEVSQEKKANDKQLRDVKDVLRILGEDL